MNLFDNLHLVCLHAPWKMSCLYTLPFGLLTRFVCECRSVPLQKLLASAPRRVSITAHSHMSKSALSTHHEVWAVPWRWINSSRASYLPPLVHDHIQHRLHQFHCMCTQLKAQCCTDCGEMHAPHANMVTGNPNAEQVKHQLRWTDICRNTMSYRYRKITLHISDKYIFSNCSIMLLHLNACYSNLAQLWIFNPHPPCSSDASVMQYSNGLFSLDWCITMQGMSTSWHRNSLIPTLTATSMVLGGAFSQGSPKYYSLSTWTDCTGYTIDYVHLMSCTNQAQPHFLFSMKMTQIQKYQNALHYKPMNWREYNRNDCEIKVWVKVYVQVEKVIIT